MSNIFLIPCGVITLNGTSLNNCFFQNIGKTDFKNCGIWDIYYSIATCIDNQSGIKTIALKSDYFRTMEKIRNNLDAMQMTTSLTLN